MAANYSIYSSINEAEHARIVIGHEIGHLLGRAAWLKSGVDWYQGYRERVHRNWGNPINHRPFEEEAVTQLSLEFEGAGYYYSIQTSQMETNPQRKAEIEAWMADFIEFLRGL